MKMNYATIIGILEKAKENNFHDWDLPMGLSIQLSRIIGKLEQEAVVFEKERHKILKKYAELDDEGELKTDEKGNAILVDREGFINDYNEMINEEIEINLKPLVLDFDKLEAAGIKKTPKEIGFLLPLLADELTEDGK